MFITVQFICLRKNNNNNNDLNVWRNEDSEKNPSPRWDLGSNPIWDSDFFLILTLEVGWLHLDMLQCDSVMLLVSFTCASPYLTV